MTQNNNGFKAIQTDGEIRNVFNQTLVINLNKNYGVHILQFNFNRRNARKYI